MKELGFQDEVALVQHRSTGLQSMTYRELLQSVDAFASGFQQSGVAKGDVLALYAPNDIYYVVVLHAALRIGATVTTVNPTYKVPEIVHQLGIANPKWLVSAPNVPGSINFLDLAMEAAQQLAADGMVKIAKIWAIGDDDFKSLAIVGVQKPLEPVLIDAKTHLALLPSSSGTTGRPKLVALTHHSIVANIVQIAAMEVYGPGDCLIGFLPFFHMFGLQVLLNVGLCFGVKLVVMPKFNGQEYVQLILEHKATVLHMVPPVATGLANNPKLPPLPSVKLVMSAAAALSADVEVHLDPPPPLTSISLTSVSALVTGQEAAAWQ